MFLSFLEISSLVQQRYMVSRILSVVLTNLRPVHSLYYDIFAGVELWAPMHPGLPCRPLRPHLRLQEESQSDLSLQATKGRVPLLQRELASSAGGL